MKKCPIIPSLASFLVLACCATFSAPPVAADDLDPDSVNSRLQMRVMLDTFEEYGWEEPDKPWENLLRRLA